MKCGKCRRPIDNSRFRYCLACRERVKVLKAARLAAGLCLDCGKLKDVPTRRCTQCLVKRRGNDADYLSRHKEERRRYHAMYRWVLKCKAVYALGGYCRDCGEEDVVVLEFDHINGGGMLDRKEGNRLTGADLWKWIVNNSMEAAQKYQVLCANCHTRKSTRDLRVLRGSTTPHPTPVEERRSIRAQDEGLRVVKAKEVGLRA